MRGSINFVQGRGTIVFIKGVCVCGGGRGGIFPVIFLSEFNKFYFSGGLGGGVLPHLDPRMVYAFHVATILI